MRTILEKTSMTSSSWAMGLISTKPFGTFLKFIMSLPWIRKRDSGWKVALFLLLLFIQSPTSAFARPQPDDSSLFREGEILLSKGEPERALWRFIRITTDFPKSHLLNDAKYKIGICYTQLKRPKDAIASLNEVIQTFPDPARMIEVFTLLGNNHLELKDRLGALRWYGKGLLVTTQSNNALEKKVRTIIDSYGSEAELKQIESLYRGAYAGGYAKTRLAQMAKRQGNEALAKKILTEMEIEYPRMDDGLQAKGLPERIPLPPKSKYTLGVILPLSGIYKPFGERVLQGIQLAIKEIESQDKVPIVSIALRDSTGNPWEAEKAVEDLVGREKVIGILGPLISLTNDRVIKKSQQMKTLLITFSQKELSSDKGEYIFQNSLLPSDQIQRLVAYAIKEL